jgi:hypothetical protein
MLTFTITADGDKAPLVLEGADRGPQAYKVRAFSADWESAVLTVKTSPPTANPPKYLSEPGADAISADGNYSFWAVRGHSVIVSCASKTGTTPITVEIYCP